MLAVVRGRMTHGDLPSLPLPSPPPSPLVRGEGKNHFSFALRESGGRLELAALHHPGYGAICADWTTLELRRRVAAGRRQLLARAIGLHKERGLRILDATAGLGRDGYTLAALGARVTLAERHPSIAALLADARRRALAEPATAEAAARITLTASDARELLEQKWDVIYLDPMYPGAGKTALAKKEMQVLRELTGGDADADALLEPARRSARLRVTVKRPLKAPWLAGTEPAFSLFGTQARFDVYLPAP